MVNMTAELICNTSQNTLVHSPEAEGNGINYEKTKTLFENVCLEIAKRYNLYYIDGKPRRAKIIEVIARTTCSACIDKELQRDMPNRVDDLYKECHQQASNILVEELFSRFSSMGLTVAISTEEMIQYCKADILIFFNGHGVSVLNHTKEVAVEIKTGYSLSLTQLYRYMLEKPDRDLVLWRIRNRQVLTFQGATLKPLLTQFMKMVILRASRLLNGADASCKHNFQERNWSPNQQQLQEAFSDFANSIIDTLPSVIEIVAKKLDGARATTTEKR
jgi:hypothetical protein